MITPSPLDTAHRPSHISGAQPVHKITGARGPLCTSATAAAVWILWQADSKNWTWKAALVPARTYTNPALFS